MKQKFYFCYLAFRRRNIKFYRQIDDISYMSSCYWSQISLRNLPEICSIPEKFTISKFFKIISTEFTSTLSKTRFSYGFQICLQYSSLVLIPNCFFGRGSFCSSLSAKFDVDLQKIFAFFFESKETTPFSFNPFHATDLFWYPLETSENLWFSDVFRGYQKRSVVWNELMIF